jgi:hypothetical protein
MFQSTAARTAIQTRSSFNLIDTAHALKVDLFVLGGGLLDRMQIARRRGGRGEADRDVRVATSAQRNSSGLPADTGLRSAN